MHESASNKRVGMERKEFVKFLNTEAFTCPRCRSKDIRFARDADAKADEITSPVALRCFACENIWEHTFRDRGPRKTRKK
jgi:DNA-directed RNA polymerase subunit M/transcription elongation factor TFIIS